MLLSFLGALGCTDSPAPPKRAGTAEGITEPPSDNAAMASSSTPSPAKLAVTTDETGRKWLTPEIPYDVYPGLPSAEEIIAARGEAPPEPVNMENLAQNTPAGAAESMEAKPEADTVASLGSTTTVPDEMRPQPAADGWEAILPIAILDDEISVVNNRLERNLLTVGSYNTSFNEVRRDGWEMSALATIAAEHPAAFSWKSNALLARDAAAALATAATQRGRDNFEEAELAGEQVAAVLNNNPPAGMDAPRTDTSREETADRAALMSRIQMAHDSLKELAIDEAVLREHVDDLNREARVLAALAKFTSHPDYGGAENQDYQTAAKDLVQAGLSMAQATAEEDFNAFQSALSRAGMACNACHQKYRFAD